ncbi:hypothetical protein AVEN_26260-1 [Araneus ventricosus]|uniref:Uncharacterized protein n=1 Tax=Araneus ventricosus TaxID=182803 RepID=A0A4Y2APA3_ARAVE|nr:hypothetical protein AVEN_26260-1 [Araneus ventricosus]
MGGFSLVIFTPRFEATQGLLWDGPRNFEQRSDTEDDAGAVAPPLQPSAPHQREGIWPRRIWRAPGPLTRRNRVSNLEPSGPAVETLPQSHRFPSEWEGVKFLTQYLYQRIWNEILAVRSEKNSTGTISVLATRKRFKVSYCY